MKYCILHYFTFHMYTKKKIYIYIYMVPPKIHSLDPSIHYPIMLYLFFTLFGFETCNCAHFFNFDFGICFGMWIRVRQNIVTSNKDQNCKLSKKQKYYYILKPKLNRLVYDFPFTLIGRSLICPLFSIRFVYIFCFW